MALRKLPLHPATLGTQQVPWLVIPHTAVSDPAPPRPYLTAGPSSHLRSYNCSSSSSAAQPMPATSEPPKAKASGPAAGSDVPRINIGVFGVMNAGKSTLMNAITRQQTSIVDSTPGTTADVKATLMELHEVGPAKLFDTAGIDEQVGWLVCCEWHAVPVLWPVPVSVAQCTDAGEAGMHLCACICV